jgi:anti-sigma B factor antagonist
MIKGHCFQVTYHDDVTVIHLDSTSLDNVNFQWSDALVEFVEQQRPRRLVVNLELVDRIQSVAIGALIRLDKRMRAYSGQLRLCGMHRDLRQVFKVTKLDGAVFRIFDSCRLARESFA